MMLSVYMALALGAGGLAAFGALGWLRPLLAVVATPLVATVRADFPLATVVMRLMARRYRRLAVGERAYVSFQRYLRPLGARGWVAFRAVQGDLCFWNGPFPIWVSRPANASDEAEYVIIRYLRGTLDFEALALEALREEREEEARRPEERYRVQRLSGSLGLGERDAPDHDEGRDELPWDAVDPVGWRTEELGTPRSRDPLAGLALGPEQRRVLDEVRFWRASQRWYEDRGIPWRRGYLLHGAPGTGKTSFARALAEELDIPVYQFDLASMANVDFVKGWQRAQADTPCLVLLEDIDCVFDGRKNVAHEEGLTFDCLLNCLDGVERAEGILLVVTTNHLEKVDPALGRPAAGTCSRPGRVDRVVELPPLDEAGRLQMALRIVVDPVRAEELSRAGAGDSVAQFQERCFRVALAEHFGERPSPDPRVN